MFKCTYSKGIPCGVGDVEVELLASLDVCRSPTHTLHTARPYGTSAIYVDVAAPDCSTEASNKSPQQSKFTIHSFSW